MDLTALRRTDFSQTRRIIVNSPLFVGASLLARGLLYLNLGLNFDPWTHRLILLELGTFVAGTLAYRFYASHKAKLAEFSYLAIPAITLIGLAIVSFLSMGMSPLQGVGFIGLIGASLPFLFARFSKTSWDLKIGELSYPVYIVHMLVITVASPPLEHRVSPSMMVAIMVVLSLAAAVILNVGFVIPLERFRHRLLKSDRMKPALRFRFFRRSADLGYANTKP